MKLSQLQVKVITGSVAATFEDDIMTFLRAGAERTLVGIQIACNGTDFVALITYTD